MNGVWLMPLRNEEQSTWGLKLMVGPVMEFAYAQSSHGSTANRAIECMHVCVLGEGEWGCGCKACLQAGIGRRSCRPVPLHAQSPVPAVLLHLPPQLPPVLLPCWPPACQPPPRTQQSAAPRSAMTAVDGCSQQAQPSCFAARTPCTPYCNMKAMQAMRAVNKLCQLTLLHA